MSRLPLLKLSCLAVVALSAACHHSPPVVASVPTGANDDSIRAARARADAMARAEAAHRDSLSRAAARADSIRRAAEALRIGGEAARRTVLAAIHFDFNVDDIHSDDRTLLDQKAAILVANPAVRVRIDGNADERGSDEYNLALGMRRAAAAKKYLTDHGVGADRFTLTSSGREHPVCSDHDEGCWSQNRRDEFLITAGGERIIAVR